MVTIGMYEAPFRTVIKVNMKDGMQYHLLEGKLEWFFGKDYYYRDTYNLLKATYERKNAESRNFDSIQKNITLQEKQELHGTFNTGLKTEWPTKLMNQWNETQNYLKKPRLVDNPRKKFLPKESLDKYLSESKLIVFHPDPFFPNIPIITPLMILAIILLLFLSVLLFFGDILGWIEGSSPMPMILEFLMIAGFLIIIQLVLGLFSYYDRFFRKKQRFISIGSEGVIFKLEEVKSTIYIGWDNVASIEDLKFSSSEYREKYLQGILKDTIII